MTDSTSTTKTCFRVGDLSQEDFDRAGLKWSELESICRHHHACKSELTTAGRYILERLEEIDSVHSLKLRIKDPEHLAAKIIRKKLQEPSMVVDSDSYQDRFTDLIGLRVLHLFKQEWKPIHDFVVKTWEQKETPTAYIRKGDPETQQQTFIDAGCQVKEHRVGYRSVQYLLRSQPSKKAHIAELQVRTIFEEGWSEIDHKVRYPRHSNDPTLSHLLNIFNLLAGSADELGTFTSTLSAQLKKQVSILAERDERIAENESELRRTIAALAISQEQKANLEKQIKALNPKVPKVEPSLSMFPDTNSISNYRMMSHCPWCGCSFSKSDGRLCPKCHSVL